MRRAFAALTCLALAAPAAADSGLLLAVRDPDGYATWWIRHQGTVVEIVPAGRDILVPRARGFWRLGVERIAGHDRLWSEPAPRAAVRPRRPGDEDPPSETDELGCVDYGSDIALLAVAPEFVALVEEEGSACYGRSNRSISARVIPFPGSSPAEAALPGMALTEVIPALTTEDVADAAATYLAAVGAGPLRSYELDVTRWGLRRARGQWQAFGVLLQHDGGRAWRNDFEIPAALPSAIAGPGAPFPWDVVKSQVPDAVDVFASPAGDLVVVLTPRELLGYVPDTPERLGRPLARQPARQWMPVLAEWAQGAAVVRWDQVAQEQRSPP